MFKEKLRSKPCILDATPLPSIEGKIINSPLHYGDTVEINFIKGIKGYAVINGMKFDLEDENVFFIPPKHLHSFTFLSGGDKPDDTIKALHINLDALQPFIDIKKMFLTDNIHIFSSPTRCNAFDLAYQAALKTVDNKIPFFEQASHLITLLGIIVNQNKSIVTKPVLKNNSIKIVEWIENNFSKKITAEDAAAYFGYNKQYFCKWLKAKTGTCFNEFLNAVRINYACTYLTNGFTVTETAIRCGFNDPSYFVKVFKKYTSTTPKAFIQNDAK